MSKDTNYLINENIKRGEEKRKQQESRYTINENGCWLWQGGIGNDGYGKVKREGKTIRAHRLFYQLHIGSIEEGMVIMHSCDNPLCVNPDHLKMGTHIDNEKDKDLKGRRPLSPSITHPETLRRGEDHPFYGKPMLPHVKEALLNANLGKVVSDESKRNLSVCKDDRVVLAIRNDPRTQDVIAKEYGISQMTVSRIKRGIRYKYVK